MASLVVRFRKDLMEMTGTEKLTKRMNKIEGRMDKLDKQLDELVKEMASVSRKAASMGRKGGPKRKPLISLVEEIMEEHKGGPMKVTEIKKILIEQKKVKTRAKNFYAVITVSMNNSPNFKKTAPGEYKLVKKPAAK